MASRNRDNIAEKVEGLASSLSATTDVLSTAERMMDHYRDLNRDQEREIALLQEELQRSDRRPERRRSRHRTLPRTPSFSDTENTRPRSRRVGFSDDQDSLSEVDEFETALHDLNRKQERLRRDLKKDQQRRAEFILNKRKDLKAQPTRRLSPFSSK